MIKILAGDNTFYVKRALEQVTGDIVRHNGLDLSDGQFTDLISAQSLFSDKRTIVIDELSANKALWDKLPDRLSELETDEDLTLILIERKPDGRSKVIKQAKKSGYYQEYKIPDKEAEAVANLEREAKNLSLKLQAGVAREIIQRVGNDTWAGFLALKKISVFGETITLDLVERYIPPSLEVNVFKLTDAMFAGQSSVVANLIDEMERTGANCYQFFGLITSQMTNLLMIKELGKEWGIKELKIHPFVADKLQNVARRVELAAIKQMIGILAETDLGLKTSSQDEWTVVKIAILKMMKLL